MRKALNGRGFIVTNGSADGTGLWQYTRDGALFGKAIGLGTDTDGNEVEDTGTLLTTANGNYVMGWQANADGTFDETNSLSSLKPILYADNSIVPAQPTTNIQLQGNLSLSTDKHQTINLPFIDQLNRTHTLSMNFSPKTNGTPDYTLDMSNINPANNPISISFDTPTINFNTINNVEDPPNNNTLYQPHLN